MKRQPPRAPMKNGFDRIGPFHPYVAFGAVILLDLIAAVLILLAIAWVADRIEEAIWPGGTDWVQFDL